MKKKPFWEMNAAELAKATKDFDELSDADRSRPLLPDEQNRWKRAKRKRGRPKEGQGFKRITVSMERGLLRRVTALAKKRQLSRSRLLAQVLEEVLAQQ